MQRSRLSRGDRTRESSTSASRTDGMGKWQKRRGMEFVGAAYIAAHATQKIVSSITYSKA